MITAENCNQCGGRLVSGDRYCAHCGAFQGAGAGPPTDESASLWERVLEELRAATIGKYDIGRMLGYGGMAAVFSADEIKLNRRVAIKVMSPSLMLAPGMIERFRREAVTVASLNHPNIVTIYTVEDMSSLHYFVMKFVSGPSLEAVIRKDGPLPASVVRVWLAQIASALGYAHRRGVVHRDIKPGNILLDDDGNAIVTDFGIAKVATAPSLTQVGSTVGTPAYMSPEQCQSKEVTAASDQYSLGIVLYEMLTGEPPFAGPSLEVMQAHVQQRPRPITVARPDCPAELQRAIYRMLAKNPDERWPSMEDVIAAIAGTPLAHDDPIRVQLAELAGALPRTPTPVPRVKTVEPPRVTPPRVVRLARPFGERLRRLWWVVPATGAAVAIVWAVTRPPDPLDRRSGVSNSIADTAVEAPTPRDTGAVSVAPAETTITAPPNGGSSSADNTVPTDVAATLKLSPRSATVLLRDTVRLTATVTRPGGRPLADRSVTWESNDPTVAAVTADGRVAGLKEGRAIITARGAGRSASATVTVVGGSVASVSVTLGRSSIRAGDSVLATASAADAQGVPLEGRAAGWSVEDASVASVSGNGTVVGLAPGATAVIALVGNVEGRATITVLVAAPTFAAVSAGGQHTCGLSPNGEVLCWGHNARGQLGTSVATSMTPVTRPGAGFEVVSAGAGGTCALGRDGSVECWGGDTKITTAGPYALVVSGGRHACALRREGSAECWGENGRGQLGDGSLQSSRSPRQVTGGVKFDTLVAGGEHTCGLASAGRAYCWGSNWAGAVGSGQLPSSVRQPTAVAGGLEFHSITAGETHTCAVTPNGAAHCWGGNRAGQLGDATREDRDRPSAVAPAIQFVALSAGTGHTCGLTISRHAFCWGRNDSGQLGTGTNTATTKPVEVAGTGPLSSISAGGAHTCAVSRTGEVRCWGANQQGQLGDGSTTNRQRPVTFGAN